MITVTRRIEFDAAHRLRDHESKCKHVHGHRYVLEATFTAPELDALGRVVDFAVIKHELGEWIDSQWDHTLILWEQDHTLGDFVDSYTGQRTYYLPYNPTAENMARYLAEHICPKLFSAHGITLTRLTLRETPNCAADIILSA